ncbi:hypothetical protein SKAU_G00078660 [Synaphobranchus kaupii]|uniref:Uncharacterized protein n=1 Tax=Synaphobranchus kaupii TaxID=118154 RepID=A0A9Q1FU78_SYNKA|nr:hypothetical protein SKAU_G00078660 [Synaphobranchus kaupii]
MTGPRLCHTVVILTRGPEYTSTPISNRKYRAASVRTPSGSADSRRERDLKHFSSWSTNPKGIGNPSPLGT